MGDPDQRQQPGTDGTHGLVVDLDAGASHPLHHDSHGEDPNRRPTD
jgi:hypothetical protein